MGKAAFEESAEMLMGVRHRLPVRVLASLESGEELCCEDLDLIGGPLPGSVVGKVQQHKRTSQASGNRCFEDDGDA
jgi:hypothetical protein